MKSLKVMQINAYYPQGSTGKIVFGIDDYLRAHGHASSIIYGRGPEIRRPGVHRAVSTPVAKLQSLRSRITGYPYGGCFLGTRRVLRLIDAFHPDVVHIHCANGYFVNVYDLLKYCKDKRIRTVITLHASFMYTGGCSHTLGCEKWKTGCGDCPQISRGTHPKTWFFDRTAQEWEMMREVFKGFRDVTLCAVSDWVREEAESSPFFEDNYVVKTIMNGVDSTIFRVRNASESHLQGEFKEKTVLLHVTPDFESPIKGGVHVTELARRLESQPEYVIAVVGKHAVHQGLPSNIRFFGEVTSEERLAEFYSLAKVTVLTSERETYSMVTAESLCCGTPVVGFEAGGPESIALPDYSRWVKYGDVEGLMLAATDCKLKLMNKDICALLARKEYSSERMCEEYFRIYSE